MASAPDTTPALSDHACNEQQLKCVQEILPLGYRYKVTSFQPKSEGKFICEVRLAIFDTDSAKLWLQKFQDRSKVTLRARASVPAKDGGKNIYKQYFRCQHNTNPVSATANSRLGSKNSECPALLTIAVQRQLGKLSRPKNIDPLLRDFPTCLRIEHTHNHSLYSADSLRHRDVNNETITKFKGLFSKGHSASSALELHKLDLHMEHGENYVYEAADRAVCPDLGFCHRLYKQVFDEKYSPTSSELLIDSLKTACRTFNAEQNGEFCKVKETASGKIAIAVCTPLMMRVHRLHRASGELVFMDASGGMDRYDCRVFLLLTHSVAGGLPLGCLIVSSEATEVITDALLLYKELLPSDAFFGRGNRGPQVYLTDDSSAERQSLQATFPEATLLLCTFHILQATWRFLWEARNNVKKESRPHLLSIIKKMVYAQSDDEIINVYDNACRDDVVRVNPKFKLYLEKQFERRSLWAVTFRKDLPVRGNNTNNYCEAAMHVLKDKIFCRTRAYNIQQLLDFLLTRFPAYYERRLLDLANGRRDVTVSRRYLYGTESIKREMVQAVGDLLFEVKSEQQHGKSYQVDMNTDMCSCPHGMTGAPCKHQHAVMKFFNVSSLNIFPVRDAKSRRHFFHLATGQDNIQQEWFQPLVDTREDVPEPCTSSTNVETVDTPFQTDNNNRVEELLTHDSEDEFDIPTSNDALIIQEFKKNIDKLLKDIENNRTELLPAVDLFNKKIAKLSTTSALSTALSCFGDNTGVSSVVRRGIIPVQPSAIARRTTYVGGRQCLQSGRKPINAEFCDKTKKRKVSESCQLLPRKKQRKAAHCISQCVKNNKSLGKCHHAK
ncbi:uncharacterized protein LOC112570910 [Pomacea canaliculata]|uniref:uncharacterized protein LOC112570910 n=1 Tax=Pomacea canaliculata TaxID=400727 RepID=UPI000D730ED9|nr:uncharacterized protein LOC112570910 [Pomacea canaliculata]